MKNIYLAAILSLFIPGLGVAYLGLYKRFLVSFVISCVLSIIVSTILESSISYIITIIIALFFAYDAYTCTEAINNNTQIPLLFTKLDIQ
ncbi:hypothetical protein [Methanosphaera sp. DEW79]|jgi:uncharacterized protein YacL|uniref:hypothetical protein n=1 Tax=Methanosphaera sp. DEW79 TaxID=1945576 RepID=UPI000DC27A0B|nr:hypothetical protein [Methanosphaera sp. DEW79]RAP47060.1 MAG: hypothetical protein BZ132_04685 [Methanosphaera sp. DEW79]